MSSSTHERKRSLQDSPVNLTKMQMSRTHLRALEEELRGIEETEEEMQQIMSHADALEAILGATKKLVRPSMHAHLCSPMNLVENLVLRRVGDGPVEYGSGTETSSHPSGNIVEATRKPSSRRNKFK